MMTFNKTSMTKTEHSYNIDDNDLFPVWHQPKDSNICFRTVEKRK